MQSTYSIPGIHCDACKNLTTEVTLESPGVTSAYVDLATKTVTIEHDETFDRDAWKQEIEALDEKYKVQMSANS